MTFVDAIITAREAKHISTKVIKFPSKSIEPIPVQGLKQPFQVKFMLTMEPAGLNITEIYPKRNEKYTRQYTKLDQQDHISSAIERFETPDMKIKPKSAIDYNKHNYVMRNKNYHNKQVAMIR